MSEGLSSALRELAKLDSSLSNVKRVAVVLLLLVEGPMSVGSLSKLLGVPINALDTHVRKLEEAGVVVKRRVITPLGPRTYVFLTEGGVERIRKLIMILDRLRAGALPLEERRDVPPVEQGGQGHQHSAEGE